MKSLKKLVMLILFLLVILFMAGMGIMSSLNLSYSQRAMSDLRLSEIEESFYANMDRIDSHHKLMEKNTAALARLGELFYRLNGQLRGDLKSQLETSLRGRIGDFQEAIGGGIWFDSHVLDPDTTNLGLYAYWDNDRVRVIWANGGAGDDYSRSEWYRTALPADWDRNRSRPEPFYWTAAYYSPILKAAVITLSTFMKDDDGRILGLATTDWRADEIIDLVSEVDLTPGSFSFLIDENNRKLSGLSEKQSLAYQSLLDQISQQAFVSYPWPPAKLVDNRYRIPMQTKTLRAGGQEHVLFFSKTLAGMIFGISVPRDDIDSVLEPMRESNYRIVFVTGAILLLLSALILYIVAGIMRLLEALYTDRLTGLPNRARLLQDLKPRGQETLILVNIDSFREINDFYGHQCGDAIIKGFADNLQAFLKGTPDCEKALLYRMPSDEFAISIPKVLGSDRLENCLNFLSAFSGARLFKWEEQDIGISITMGAADTVSTSQAQQPAENGLLPFANMALKTARSQRRSFRIYDSSLRVLEEYEQNLVWAKRLKAALEDGRIRPYFQPIYNNRTGEVEKFECLVRLVDEQGQPVLPTRFLHIGKKLRLYRSITLLMVEKVIEAFKAIPYEFSINLAYEDISDPKTTGFIKKKLKESGLAGRAVFEILESEIITNYDQVYGFVEEFQSLGCKIAIDDFGSGYSNFEHLLRLKADIIKIDGSLIRNLDSDPNAVIVADGIVDFARKLNMLTVAEFVHSDAVHRKVKELGIDYSQGNFIGAAQPEPRAKTGDPIPLAQRVGAR